MNPDEEEEFRVYVAAHEGLDKLRRLQEIDNSSPLTQAMKIEFISDTLDYIERRTIEKWAQVGIKKKRSRK